MDAGIVAIVSAALGGTGLIGVVTALITRTRVSRLRRFIDEANAVRGALGPESRARAYLDQAVDTAALRLSAAELARSTANVRFAVSGTVLCLIVVLVGCGVLLLSFPYSVSVNEALTFPVIWIVILLVAYVALGIMTAVALVQVKRESIMAPALLKLPTPLKTPSVKHARRLHVQRRRLAQLGAWDRRSSASYDRAFRRRIRRMRADRDKARSGTLSRSDRLRLRIRAMIG